MDNQKSEILEKIEDAINSKIDIPNVSEEQEGFLIHLLIALAATVVYILIKNL
jgi:hypothetical protein